MAVGLGSSGGGDQQPETRDSRESSIHEPAFCGPRTSSRCRMKSLTQPSRSTPHIVGHRSVAIGGAFIRGLSLLPNRTRTACGRTKVGKRPHRVSKSLQKTQMIIPNAICELGNCSLSASTAFRKIRGRNEGAPTQQTEPMRSAKVRRRNPSPHASTLSKSYRHRWFPCL